MALFQQVQTDGSFLVTAKSKQMALLQPQKIEYLDQSIKWLFSRKKVFVFQEERMW